jgi:hypothetical protein
MVAWLISVLAGPAGVGLIALTAVTLTCMIAALLARGARLAAARTARPQTGQVTALFEKSWCAAFQRQLDPDAAGRARPRAPSAVPAAA